MARWTDLAEWTGTPNHGGPIEEHLYLVEHTAEGTYTGTISWQQNRASKVSSHFIVAKDGRAAQMVDTAQQAWTQILGNPYSVSVENEGHPTEQLTPAQIEKSAQILARAHREHGIPLQVTNRVGTPGLGHHSMGYESGVNWGHNSCPGQLIIAQKPWIVARAEDIVNGDTMDPEDFKALIWRVEAILNDRPTVIEGPTKGEENKLHTRLVALALAPSQVDVEVAVESALNRTRLEVTP